jgi:AcrB/AcrD/AcrF family
MKSFTDLFIKRPVLAMVVSFVILIAGLQAMKTINVRQYPRSDIAAITVTTVYIGADAELVRIYYDAAGASNRGRGRDRLHPIAKHAGCIDDHGASETEL